MLINSILPLKGCCSENGLRRPIVIIAFDDAHQLTDLGYDDQNWTVLSELRHALRELYEQPIFTLFLSTDTSKFHQSIRLTVAELARNIPDGSIKGIHTCLQVSVNLKIPYDEIDIAYVQYIHGIVRAFLKPSMTTPISARFVDQETFEKNIEGQKGQFCDVMRSAGRSPLCRDELEKLIAYGMCLYYGTSQIINVIIQMHSGLFHPTPLSRIYLQS